MKLIVGLGNPGDQYARHRHNIGFLAVDEIAKTYRFGPWKSRFHGASCDGLIAGEKCVLLKPATFMNESGRAVGEAVRFFKLGTGDVIVIHDELDLEPGKVRVKAGGGNAGHNGLKSISAYIGNDYRRVRLGIGHPGDKTLVARYVLHDFSKAERDWLEPLLASVARGMPRLVEGNDAAFLSEAARARVRAPQPERLNGRALPPEAAPSPAPSSRAPSAVSAPPAAAYAPRSGKGEPMGLGEKLRFWIASRFRGTHA